VDVVPTAHGVSQNRLQMACDLPVKIGALFEGRGGWSLLSAGSQAVHTRAPNHGAML